MRTSAAIGNTPLIKISDSIYAKLESVNPSGSIKDRMAAYILDQAELNGQIKPGQIIVEATSGNTGIAFSMLAAERGYKMIVVMPCNMSQERKSMIKAYGAKIVEVGSGDFAGACVKRDQLCAELGAFCPNQFVNPDNRICHREKTAVEILGQLERVFALRDAAGLNCGVDAFIARTGTGGTLMGVSDGLRSRFSELKIVAVEPTQSAVMSGGKPGEHLIQGIGDGFIPEIVDMNYVDEVIAVSDLDAVERAKRLAKELGLFVGISSGANVLAAEKYLEKHQPKGILVTVLPDNRDRYMSLISL